MEDTDNIEYDLRIPKKAFRKLSESRFICIVPDAWTKFLQQGRYAAIQPSIYGPISDCDLARYLAPSTCRVNKPWERISIKRFTKHDAQVKSLVGRPLCRASDNLTQAELMVAVSKLNRRNVAHEARSKYSAAFWPEDLIKDTPQIGHCDRILSETLQKLFKSKIIKIGEGTDRPRDEGGSRPHPRGPDPHPRGTDRPSKAHPNISGVFGIIETPSAFYVIQPFVQYTLLDCVMFSPQKVSSSYTKQLFIVYQALQGMKYCHSHGVSVGDLKLCDVFMDDKLWINLNVPSVTNIYREIPGGQFGIVVESSPADVQSFTVESSQPAQELCTNYRRYLHDDLPAIVAKWTAGEITNFDYLMILNHLANRNMWDPNHHPVLPWVTDFTCDTAFGGYRDLSRSKYRLNKGDRQLDLTYNTYDPEALNDPMHIPHHISEVLSDITYYVYMARRTSKQLLCTHVRSKWVPHEYPSTMQRLQEWTPDECIPEFFTDPTIFKSIHPDLPDLGIPQWAGSPEGFVRQHMAVLEGEYVSARLHLWIDLTFGFKLSGSAAERSKNVCLQLVDQHSDLSNHGVVQLFNYPHPQRQVNVPPLMTLKIPQPSPKRKTKDGAQTKKDEKRSKSQVSSTRSGTEEASPILLPQGYNPLHALEQLEATVDFCSKVAKTLPPPATDKPEAPQDHRTSLVARDMQALGCLIVELFMPSKLRTVSPESSLDKRYQLVRAVYSNHYDDVPRPARHPAKILLNLPSAWSREQVDEYGSLFKYDIISRDGLPPPSVDLLLHPSFPFIPFPDYFPGFYILVFNLRVLEGHISGQLAREVTSERTQKIRSLAKYKVSIAAQYLTKMPGSVGKDALEILLPYVTEMIEDPLTSAQAAWSLFNPLAKALGPADTSRHLLKLLTKLFDEEETTPKFMKIYHRSYVMQLVVRFGLETFLVNFCTLLIEAAAAYKNFLGEELMDRQLSNDTEEVQYPGVFINEGFRADDQAADDRVGFPAENTGVFSMSLDDDEDRVVSDRLKAPPDPEVGSSGSGSGVSQEDAHDSQSSGVREAEEDSASIGSGEVSEEALGKSLGRLSVHSVSRLIEEERGTLDTSGSQDEEEDAKENGEGQVKDGEGQVKNGEGQVKDGEGQVKDEDEGDTAVKETSGDTVVVRHDTEDFTTTLMNPVGDVEYNISDVASETIKWLAHRLGPVLTAKHLSRNLLRMLGLCYLGKEQLEPVSKERIFGEELSTTKTHVVGDVHACQLLECLSCIVILYGEEVILLQYFQHIKEMVRVSAGAKRLNNRTEAGLLSCVTLLIHIIPYLSDSTLMDILQDSLFKDMLLPLLKLVSSQHLIFPSGSLGRSVICFKLIDVLYIISLRIGFEMTRENMTFVLQKFFAAFNRVYEKVEEESSEKTDTDTELSAPSNQTPAADDKEEIYFEIKKDTQTNEYKVGTALPSDGGSSSSPSKGHKRQSSLGTLKHSLSPTKEQNPDELEDLHQSKRQIMKELKETFTPALAHAAYIPFCKLAGGIHMEQHLINDDLIRHLCSIHDQKIAKENSPSPGAGDTTSIPNGVEQPLSPGEEGGVVSGSFGRNVSVEGNKIMIQDDPNTLTAPSGSSVKVRRRSGGSCIDSNKLRSPEMKMNTQRHLKGNWLAYWEHEVGMADRETGFNFKQIKLQTFTGHTSSVRSFSVLDNENSFISASKDKTVKLWSLRSIGDGSAKVGAQWTYNGHKKSVFSVSFLESVRHVASCDSNIHIWDPFIGMPIRQWEAPKNSPISVVTTMPAPHSSLITASSDSVLRFLDVRKGSFTHEFKCTTLPAGLIRTIGVSPDGHQVAVGYSSGVISTLDLRTGFLIASWKAHDGEILQIKSHDNKGFLSSSFDQTMHVWNFDDVNPVCSLKGFTEPVHCFSFYKGMVISATTASKIGVHSSYTQQASFTNTKLKSDVFRGVLTTMSVLPLNRLLLLGSDSGEIRLLA